MGELERMSLENLRLCKDMRCEMMGWAWTDANYLVPGK
jgi:hypothetical protein